MIGKTNGILVCKVIFGSFWKQIFPPDTEVFKRKKVDYTVAVIYQTSWPFWTFFQGRTGRGSIRKKGEGMGSLGLEPFGVAPFQREGGPIF